MNDNSTPTPSPATLTYRMLGPLQLANGDRHVPLAGSKPRAVAAVLLIHRNTIVPTDQLIAAVWNDQPPASAESSLQVAVSSLRRSIRATDAADPITTTPPGYRLHTPPGTVDLDDFLRVRAAARTAQTADDPVTAGARYREALELWKGDPLADLRGLRFADEFATAWNEERLLALQDRINCDLRCGHHEQTIPELISLTNSHPLRETLWAQLITALNRSGRQADALDAARRLRTLLAEELGIDPSPDLQALEQRVLRQQPDPPATTAADPAMLQTIAETSGPTRGHLTDLTGKRYPITTTGTRIGRQTGNEITVHNGKASRWHAIVVDTGTAFVISDLNSTNGTKVGPDRIIGSQELHDGDQITIGDLQLTLHAPGPSPPRGQHPNPSTEADTGGDRSG